MKYRITKDVDCVQGWQSWIVEAGSKKEALEIFDNGGGDFETEELEVQSFSDAKPTVEEVGEDEIEKKSPQTPAAIQIMESP